MVSISYCVTACNEHKELDKLLSILVDKASSKDEIVIQVDSSNVTSEVISVIENYSAKSSQIRHVQFPLNKDFASFKNNAYAHCTKEYIFQIDADEYPSDVLMENVHNILEMNPHLELLLVPRVNTVSNITDTHVSKWNWSLNNLGWINYPDYQTRISKNSPDIKWLGKVHERLVREGYTPLVSDYLPMYHNLDLIHEKDIERQEKQNNFYNTI